MTEISGDETVTEKRTLWMTVEDTTHEEMEDIIQTFDTTSLSEKYELIVTRDELHTMSQADVEDLVKNLQNLYE